MVVQAPPPPAPPDPGIEAGVIQDARRRQQRHRRIGAFLIAAAAAGALGVGMAAGGGGSGDGLHHGARPAGSGPGGGAAHASVNTAFPRAPVTQPNGYGVEGDVCPLAPPNRYLPARSGCVTARRADINGDGRSDLVIVYSLLSRRHPSYFNGEPRRLLKDFFAERAYLKIVLAGGGSVSTPIAQPKLTHAAAVDAIARVNGSPDSEIFLEVMRISSGATGVAYGLHNGRLEPAGSLLYYGGDSAAAGGFNCLAGSPPRLIQRSYLLLGPTISGWWKEIETTYTWRGPRLVETASRTFKRRGAVTNADRSIGPGCTRGVR